ncbi:MAG: hypothetical protein WBA46_16360 [Thermomicrobiales bacterium]
MTAPLSHLTYTRIQEQPASRRASVPTVITLHAYRQRGSSLADHARAAAPDGRLLGLESYKGVFVGREVVGSMWFAGPDSAPAPVFFGDALGEIERFLWDEIDRQDAEAPVLPFLLGVGQGAIMALAAAAAVPDLLSGVIAIDGSFPIVPGWEPPLAPLAGLPILLIDEAEPAPEVPGVLTGDALMATLAAWGGDATRHTAPGEAIPADLMRDWLADQPIRTRPAR